MSAMLFHVPFSQEARSVHPNTIFCTFSPHYATVAMTIRHKPGSLLGVKNCFWKDKRDVFLISAWPRCSLLYSATHQLKRCSYHLFADSLWNWSLLSFFDSHIPELLICCCLEVFLRKQIWFFFNVVVFLSPSTFYIQLWHENVNNQDFFSNINFCHSRLLTSLGGASAGQGSCWHPHPHPY